jgi:hypothetical protein
LLAAVKNAICGTPLGLVIDGSVACKPLSGQSVTLFLILGQRKQDDRWMKLDETLRSHSPSIEWASAKTTAGRDYRGHQQCLYGCSSVAQLNDCGKGHACSAATYSVNGTQRAAGASNNISSRVEKRALYARFYGTCVPEVTSNAGSVHDTSSDTQPSRNSRGLAESSFIAFTTLAEPGFSPCK